MIPYMYYDHLIIHALIICARRTYMWFVKKKRDMITTFNCFERFIHFCVSYNYYGKSIYIVGVISSI